MFISPDDLYDAQEMRSDISKILEKYPLERGMCVLLSVFIVEMAKYTLQESDERSLKIIKRVFDIIDSEWLQIRDDLKKSLDELKK